jgi:8-oxo-dGTP pyrophosphatase MutT (NUDIX family)
VSDTPRLVIPSDRLPPGFAERVADPPADAAVPRPASTIVLVRDGAGAPELLLLRRHGSAGFVPGAYVFPGGRVDDADADPRLVGILGETAPEPPPAYWLAGIRELYEETGVLLARDAASAPYADATRDARVAEWRETLMTGGANLFDALTALAARPDASRMVYCAHWITPLAEPRRYDTRFFLAELPPGAVASIDEREMTDAVWVTAAAAVTAFESGELPMVFPTIKTIQRLTGYRTVDEMIAAFRGTTVPAVLPRLVRTPDGVGIVLDDDGKGEMQE